ncbi:hypothetical protein [Planotetraspora sp. GP83]|uniref:hypothetical protein n=1 Tax=Planotetraspora sp. GP83 TaxID=3156264 RepID=UPI003512D949
MTVGGFEGLRRTVTGFVEDGGAKSVGSGDPEGGGVTTAVPEAEGPDDAEGPEGAEGADDVEGAVVRVEDGSVGEPSVLVAPQAMTTASGRTARAKLVFMAAASFEGFVAR